MLTDNKNACADQLLADYEESRLSAVERTPSSDPYVRRFRPVLKSVSNCGANAPGGGGFQPGNTCATLARNLASAASEQAKAEALQPALDELYRLSEGKDGEALDEILARYNELYEKQLGHSNKARSLREEAESIRVAGLKKQFGTAKEIEDRRNELYGKFPAGPAKFDDPAFKEANERLDREEERWEQGIKRAITLGQISEEDARQLGLHLTHGKPYEPLPKQLWHVTTAVDKVMADGLKTRDELRMSSGIGLGGGPGDTISTTWDREAAEAIHRGMLEAHDVANNKITVQDILAEAESLGVATKLSEIDTIGREWVAGTLDDPEAVANLPYSLRGLVEGKEYKRSTLGSRPEGEDWEGVPGSEMGKTFTLWRRNQSAENQQWDRFQLYKRFSYLRQQKTGQLDPLFFNSDVEAFAELDPAQIQIVELGMKPGTHGYKVEHEREYRVHTGDAIDSLQVVDPAAVTKKSMRFVRRLNAQKSYARFVLRCKSYKPDIRDGDGDGKIYDGTKWERAAPQRQQGERLTRLTVNGTGLLNNAVLDRMKLTDDEEMELAEEMDFGLEQPRGVASDAVFYFTDEGLRKHERMIELLEVAAKGPVDRQVVYADEFVWESSDGQVAIDPSKTKDSATPKPVMRQTETPEFKRWFGDSKVVNEDGTPKMVFHGGRFGMEGEVVFQNKNDPPLLVADEGFFFTDDVEMADWYADENAVTPVFLSLRNPKVYHPGESVMDASRERLKAEGYDGWIAQGGKEFVVFDPTQIKSAIGNDGSFDASNPDITKSLRKSVDCGANKPGGGGFQPGNDCAAEDGNASSGSKKKQQDEEGKKLPFAKEKVSKFAAHRMEAYLTGDDSKLVEALSQVSTKEMPVLYSAADKEFKKQRDEWVAKEKQWSASVKRVSPEQAEAFAETIIGKDPEARKQYKAVVKSVVERMTPKQMEGMQKVVRKVFVAETQERMRAFYSAYGDELSENEHVCGVFVYSKSKGKGDVVLDGIGDSMGAFGARDIAGIASHEFAHVVDAANGKVSDSAEWRKAWGKEIAQKNRRSPTLTRYATMNASEGFAEYSRLVNDDPDMAISSFPQAWEVYKKVMQ